MTGDLSTIYRKIGATKANINFLTKCRKCNLIPKGFLSKKRIFTKKSNQKEERFAKIRMREMQNSLHAKTILTGVRHQNRTHYRGRQDGSTTIEKNPG